jgi:TRAP-type mannitol/chloroaromatic compound transport system permease large subunit
MFFDDTAMLVIVAPLYVPLVKMLDLGFENPRDQMIWFGVLYTMTCQIAYITPPFGYNLFLMRGLAPREITIVDIYRSIWPFVIMMMLTIAVVMAFPEMAMIVPHAMR